MYGNLRAVAKGPADALQESNMVGIGMCPEGIETNPIVYDLMPEWAYRWIPSSPTLIYIIYIFFPHTCRKHSH